MNGGLRRSLGLGSLTFYGVSIALSVIGLFVIGAAITVITGRNASLETTPGALRGGGRRDNLLGLLFGTRLGG